MASTHKCFGTQEFFLGLAEFFRRSINYFTRLATPLPDLSRKYRNINRWGEKCDTGFQCLKDPLISTLIMQVLDWSKLFKCHTDTCQHAVGRPFTRVAQGGTEHVISYFSNLLSLAKENYSAIDIETLGLVYLLQRFRWYLEPSEFEVFTDNQVYSYFFS